jgi:major membrane immunogen (membrane-anchored lipoprotein)
MSHSALLILSAFLTLVLLSACGPVSVAEAEQQCFARAYDASGPHGEVAVGIADGKSVGRVELGISSDYLMGRDPSAVYDQCVYQKSGQPPRQPLYSRADWKG